jgi:hypothetical protein
MLGSDKFTLYGGCTYHVYYTTFIPDGGLGVTGGLRPTTGPVTVIASETFGTKCAFSLGHPPVYMTDYFIFQDTAFSVGATLDYEVSIDSVTGLGCDSTATSVEAQIFYVSGPDPRFPDGPGIACVGAPRIGQQVRYTDPVGDGTTTAFDTTWAYMPNSLHVLVNGLDWTPEVNETDPGAGGYSLDYPVPLDATVIVQYRRAA